mmetsp:Transcript_15819/g.23806  ORF Transcript_15819/g.23806 Transcript_15819/m.23806 type:complete len:457 (-) Transcript_15819:428-1798(-)|eukprot:CAMPEP_0185018512 /NCGR_PEP_ID=MMETSP1103-20130426/1212_1 /TAXON_ID=36769 /ORGANISM="Paraphysomonas bandaiensis, Strain Caron Lab Isolate" /LENGTH=456 /DNA_ID=CAMNT_0027548351 /DNA_START=38 /DNA_END=1408 /DNA_ORIENTATION=+
MSDNATESSPAQDTATVLPSEEHEHNHDNDLDQELKRKREELTSEHTDDNNDDNKKPKLNDSGVANAPPYMTASGEFFEKLEVSPSKVGQIIGSRGAIIQEMQTRSGCKIHVNQDFPEGVNREVTFTGTQEQIAAARKLVDMVLEKGPTAIHMLNGPVITQEIDCPQSLVGRVIGAGGATIRDIQTRCAAKVQIDQDFPEGVPRKIQITGNQDAVHQASMMIKYVMDNGPPGPMGIPSFGMDGSMGMPQQQMPPANSNPGSQIIECAKQYVGRIIGRGGETINLIQGRSGARVQIDQNVPEGTPCKVNITGLPQCVVAAAQMVQEIIANGPNRLSMMGAPGGMGGMGGAFYGQQQAPYGMPQYGYPPQQGGMYQQQSPYMAPQQQYGGGYSQSNASAYGAGASGWTGQQQTVQQPAQQQTKPPPLPAGWSEHKTEDGNTFWYNSGTGVSQWERPTN